MSLKRKLFTSVNLLSFSLSAALAQDLETTIVESSPAPAVPVPTVEQRQSAPVTPVQLATVQEVVVPETSAEVATTVATRTPKLAPPAAEVTSVSTLDQYQRFDLNDVLRQTSGLSLVQNGGPGTVTGLSIRGLQSDQNVVLFNGRRLPPGLASQYQLEFFDVSTLESVQVLKGSASSLYGADAIAGVIDLKSTDARYVETNGLSVYAEAGSFDTFRTGGTLSFRDDRLGAVIEAISSTTDADRPNSDFENQLIRGNVAYDLGDGIWLDVLAFIQSAEVGVPGSSFVDPNSFFAAPFPANQRNLNDSFLVSPRLTIQRDQWNAEVFYNYNQNELDNIQSTEFFGFDVDGSLRQIGRETEGRFNYTGIDNTVLTLGGGHYDFEFSEQPIGTNSFVAPSQFSFSYTSVYGQADTLLPGGINLVASVRHDNHDTFEDATTYSVSASKYFDSTGTEVFGRFGTGYRPPTGQDILFIVNPSGLDLADLQPEESQSWEIGFKQHLFNQSASVAVTYFENEFTDSIEFDPINFGQSTVDGETSGFEIEGTVELGSIDFYTNYTYLDTEVTGGAGNLSGQPGDRLIRRPRHAFNAGAVLSQDAFSLGLELHGEYDRFDRALTPRFVDDYTTTRIFGSYQLSDRIEVYGRVENLFDEDYQFTRGFEAPGRGVFGGLRWTFGE